MQLGAIHGSVSLQPGFLLVTSNGLEFLVQLRKVFSHMLLVDLPSGIGVGKVAEDVGIRFSGATC